MQLHDSIPNNVDLASDRRLLRALEHWQPSFQQWWRDMGPEGFQAKQVYLRSAVSVDSAGWAHFDYVRMPEYRWGIFLAEPSPAGPSASVTRRGSRSGRKSRASIATCCAA